MSRYRCSVFLVLSMAMAEICSESHAAKPEDKLKLLQGRWVIVESYMRLPLSDPSKLIGGPHDKPEYEIEFIHNVGVFREILPDGSRKKPAPFCWLVDTRTDPISCDRVDYSSARRGEPPRHLLGVGILKIENDKLKIAVSANALRPKSFDIFRDRNVGELIICQRATD